MGAVAELSRRGVEFLASEKVRPSERGALTKAVLGGVMFELVHADAAGAAMNYADIGIDTASLAGSLESKLAAARAAGFAQVMISASDIVGHPGGTAAGARAVRESGLRVTGLEALRDFEGLDGAAPRVQARRRQGDARRLRPRSARACCWSRRRRRRTRTPSADAIVRDLTKLAVLAVPLGIRIAFKGLSWSRTVKDFAAAGDLVFRANCPNLGIAIDAFDVIAAGVPPDDVEGVDPEQIFLVQLSDYMWQEIRTAEEEEATARHFRVFPGEGAHSEALALLVTRLDAIGYYGDYSFDVYNDDYLQMPPGDGRGTGASRRRLARRDGAAPRAARAEHGAPAAALAGLKESRPMAMEYRRLGESGLEVSALCLGTMMFGVRTEAADAQRIIDTAFDQGVNFIDTADAYGKGAAERIVGAAIKAQRRRWIVATKVVQPDDRAAARRRAVAALDHAGVRRQSRAAVDRLDRHLLPAPRRSGHAARRDDRRDGRPRSAAARSATSACRTSADGVSPKSSPSARRRAFRCPVVCQPHYNLLDRMPEIELLPACDFYGIGVAPYSPIARGVLTGKYRGGALPDDSRAGRKDKRMLETDFRAGVARRRRQARGARGEDRPHAAPVRARLAVGEPDRLVDHRRSAHARAVERLRRRARHEVACATTRRSSIRSSGRASRRRRSTTTRSIRSSAGGSTDDYAQPLARLDQRTAGGSPAATADTTSVRRTRTTGCRQS